MGRARSSNEAKGVVRAGVSGTLRAYLKRYPGIELDRLALSAGVDPSQLGNPDAFLDQQHWFTLVEAAARETGDGYFAIGFVEQMPWKDLGVLGYVALHSATVGDALDNMARFFAVQQTGGRLALEVRGDAHYQYILEDPRIEDHGQMTEGTFAMVVRMIREATGELSWSPREIALRHEAPRSIDRHQKFFRGAMRFGQRTNTLTFPAADLARRFTNADPGLLPHLLRHATECLAKMPKGEADDVHRAVIGALGAGDPTIEYVASALGQSPRSLQRKLQSEGRSFKGVVEDTRLDLAKRYLKDSKLSLTETAFLLGYSDLSAFSRAFRRWTDVSPIEFRSRESERASRTAPTAVSSPRSTRSR